MSASTLEAARWEMVEAGGRTAQSFGLTRLFGQIYMLLYLCPRALCLDELTGHLKVSKASVSIACRQLEAWGAVRRVAVSGDRRDFYQAETDFGKLINSGVLIALEKKLDSARRQIERSLNILDQEDADGKEHGFLRQRLQEANRRRAKLARLISNPLLRRML